MDPISRRRHDEPPGTEYAEPGARTVSADVVPPLHVDDRILGVLADRPTVLAADAYLNPALAPAVGRAPTMGPAMAPLHEIRSPEQLVAAIDAEKSFLHLAGRWASPAERREHEEYLRQLVDLRDHGGVGLVERAKIDESRRRLALEEDLARMGDATCRAGESVEALATRRDALRLERLNEHQEREAATVLMDEDGAVGTRRDLAAREVVARVEAANPGSGTGALFAGLAAARGASLKEIREAGESGNLVEALWGGVGAPLNQDRARPKDGARRGARAGLGMLRTRSRSVSPLEKDGIFEPPPIPKGLDGRGAPKPSRGVPEAIPRDAEGFPVANGKRPMNFEYSGRLIQFPEELRIAFPEGLRFTVDGFPDYSPYAAVSVEIEGLIGDTNRDFRMANEAAGLGAYGSNVPRGWTWHHCEDGRTMQLVPQAVHKAFGHTGGEAILKHLRRMTNAI